MSSLFTFVISSGYSRSLAPVLERFHRRREELARELGLSGLAPIFGKRVNRHIIGSQNDFIHLLRADLGGAAPPLEVDRMQWVEDSLNESPMSYLEMKRLYRHNALAVQAVDVAVALLAPISHHLSKKVSEAF